MRRRTASMPVRSQHNSRPPTLTNRRCAVVYCAAKVRRNQQSVAALRAKKCNGTPTVRQGSTLPLRPAPRAAASQKTANPGSDCSGITQTVHANIFGSGLDKGTIVGGLKILCIGVWMWFLTKIIFVCEKTILRRIWLWCGILS